MFSDMLGWFDARPSDDTANDMDASDNVTISETSTGSQYEMNGFAYGENGGFLSFDGLYGPSETTSETSDDQEHFDPNMYETIIQVESGHTATVYGYAWGTDMGWVSMNCAQDIMNYSGAQNTCDQADQANHEVKINDQGAFYGFAYSENAGYISFSGNTVNSGNYILQANGWKPNLAPRGLDASDVSANAASGVWTDTTPSFEFANSGSQNFDTDDDEVKAHATLSGVDTANTYTGATQTGQNVISDITFGNDIVSGKYELTAYLQDDFYGYGSNLSKTGGIIHSGYEYWYDGKNPNVSGVSITQDGYQSSSGFLVSVDASDEHSGIASQSGYYYEVQNASGNIVASGTSTASGFDVSVPETTEDVTYSLNVEVEDAVGNVSSYDAGELFYDNHNPEITAVDGAGTGAGNWKTSRDLGITVEGDDNKVLHALEYQINGTGSSWTHFLSGSFASSTQTGIVLSQTQWDNLSNAAHDLYIRAIDEAGNISQISQVKFGKNYDEQSPQTLEISTSSGGVRYNGSSISHDGATETFFIVLEDAYQNRWTPSKGS